MDCSSPGRASGGRWVASTLIWVLHVAYVAFVALAPFGSNRTLLVLHALTTPMVWVHWLLNDDQCALTVLEKAVRGVDDDRSFFHALVSPVYKVRDADLRAACWVASLALWAVTVSKLTWTDVVDELAPAGTRWWWWR